MRNTKIVCTLGPGTDNDERLKAMINAGANVFRFNMSHGKHEWVEGMAKRIRAISAACGREVGLLLDTQGPSIRTGPVESPIALKPGDLIDITVNGAAPQAPRSITVDYQNLINDITVGDTVLVDNGVIHLQILSKSENVIHCKALTEGSLGSRRHINLPGVRLSLPALTEKDVADVRFAATIGIDFVALSFVNEPGDISELRALLESLGCKARIVAKIETQTAVGNLDEIIRRSDAIMIARGDLGVECPMEDLPIIQRRIVKRCIRLGRPVIVATHMLESMIENPLPTRAEVTDVANAVFEQADAIMLSAESAMGRYPVECVKVLDRIAQRIERSGGAGYAADALLEDLQQKTVRSAVVLADSLANSKIIVFTRRGIMATHTSNLRPDHSLIFAFAPKIEVVRRLALNWGTEPLLLDFDQDPREIIASAMNTLRDRGLTKVGDRLVIISDVLAGEFLADSIQLRTVKE